MADPALQIDSTPEGQPRSRQARRRENTRRQLVGAARAIIIESGVAGLRIGELTEIADVGRGSFYNHFQSKDELVAAVVSDTLETLAGTLLEHIPEHEDPAVAAAIADRKFIRLAYEDPTFAQLMVQLNHADDVFARATLPYARTFLERGIRTGRFRLGNIDVALMILTGGAIALIRAILAGHAPPNADAHHAEAMLTLFGVPGDEARKISRRRLP